MRERIECVEDGSFRFSIESRRDLVEDDERTRLEEGACKSKAAPLPGRKRMTARAERRGKPRGKPGEEAAERRLFECGTQALFRRVRLPKTDVFGEPAVGAWRPARRRSKGGLPAPLAPMIAVFFPARKSRSRWSRTASCVSG